ncbi:MAG: hypothetical protein EOO03_05335 [Chitinophagaceae bacterium]|nr:MAG: hypothetical protein EOO03_05335 [Chitinophagaceae bacterium]
MKVLLLKMLLLCTIHSSAQNVGIGNNNPAEKLDVTGNINVTGTIKANGVDGTANQVLMKNNAGTMEWGDVGEFKNFLTYYSNGIFTVPAGVTKIMVEMWGGGGGGNFYCGGGGGGYLKIQLQVAANQQCNVTVGSAGAGANNATAANGGDSYFAHTNNVYTAIGGKGAVYVASSRFNPGLGGSGITMGIPMSYIIVPGTTGGYQTKTYGQTSATTFFEITTGGNGGSTYKFPNSGGVAGHNISNMTTSSTVITNAANPNGQLPGGGGASGMVSLGAALTPGAGASGMVVIHY